MKLTLIKIFRIFLLVMPIKVLVIFLEQLFIVLKLNPIRYAYDRIGIEERDSELGEKNFLTDELPKILGIEKETRVTIFDVGANKGKYSQWVKDSFCNSKIYSFEPLLDAYNLLAQKFENDDNVFTVNAGLSDREGKMKLHTYANDEQSEHATMHSEVLLVAHGSKDNIVLDITVTSIDSYCFLNNIDAIDFLKIDTEGHEYKVLEGAGEMLRNNRIGVIQFEFNEMNVFSRVYLKDFFGILNGYRFYRISRYGLIPLEKYSTEYEIFRFQNIISVNPDWKR
jgi:FkbM family methyltransferase